MPDTFSPPYGLTVTDLLNELDRRGTVIAANRHQYPDAEARYQFAYTLLAAGVRAYQRGSTEPSLTSTLAHCHLTECSARQFSHWLREAEARRDAVAAARSEREDVA